jgi:hypothetical protein
MPRYDRCRGWQREHQLHHHPTLYLDNDDNFNITLKAYGTTGSALVIQTNNKNYAAYFESSDNSEHGTIDNTFTIPDRDKAQVIYLYTLDKNSLHARWREGDPERQSR